MVTDPLPRGLTFVSAAGTDWTCSTVLFVVRCAYDLPLPVNRFAPQIDVVVTVGTREGVDGVSAILAGDKRD